MTWLTNSPGPEARDSCAQKLMFETIVFGEGGKLKPGGPGEKPSKHRRKP